MRGNAGHGWLLAGDGHAARGTQACPHAQTSADMTPGAAWPLFDMAFRLGPDSIHDQYRAAPATTCCMDAFTKSRTLQRDSGSPALHLQLAQRLQRQIRDQFIAPGARLASVREFARQHGVNPQTVVAAYDLLQAQGLIEARPRQGFFVREPVVRPASPSRHARTPPPPPTHATALLRGMFAHLQQPAESLRAIPGAGTLPAEWLRAPGLVQSLRQVLRDEDFELASASYARPEGDERLRSALARRLGELELGVSAHNILLCNGATQALDLIVRAFTRPGDAVMVEQPGWAVQFAQLAQAGLQLLPVPRGPDGPDLQRVQHWARTRRPRLMVVVSRLHNPTGGHLRAACAHRLLELAREHHFLLVEDDVYAPLCEPGSPLVSAMDGLQRSILVGGFSKLLAPGWRVGFLAASAPRLEVLRDAKLLAGLSSPMPTERALALLLERGGVHRMAAALRARLARARQRAVRLAREHGCRFETPPQGLFGWVDTGVDADRLALRLHDAGYLIAPGRLFDPDGQPSSCMRLNFAHAQDLGFWAEFTRARRALMP